MPSPLLVQDAFASPAHAHLLAVVQPAVPDAGRLAALAAHHHEVAGVDRGLALEDPALDVALRVRTRVLAGEVHSLDDRPALARKHPQDPGLAAAILAGEHHHRVVLLHVHALRRDLGHG